MKKWSDLSAEEIFTFYYQKLNAMREGDLTKLSSIKKACPELFDKRQLLRIENLICFAKEFSGSSLYRELKRLKMKRALFVVK